MHNHTEFVHKSAVLCSFSALLTNRKGIRKEECFALFL